MFCSETWPGYATDVKSLLPVVTRLGERFGITRMCVVADRERAEERHRQPEQPVDNRRLERRVGAPFDAGEGERPDQGRH